MRVYWLGVSSGVLDSLELLFHPMFLVDLVIAACLKTVIGVSNSMLFGMAKLAPRHPALLL